MPSVRLLLLSAIVAAAAASVRPARAADPRALTWTVRAQPECGARGVDFAREVELACDAVDHGCRVVDRGADRQAVLACPRAAPWTLEARTEAGVRLWTIAVRERPESRLRVAAMWLARAERDAAPPDAPVVAVAPPHPPAVAGPTRSTRETVDPRAAAPAPPPLQPAPSPAPARSPAPAPSPSPPAFVAPGAPASSPSTPSSLPPSSPSPSMAGAPDALAPRDAELPSHRGGLALAIRGGLGGDLAPGSLGASVRAAVGLPSSTHAALVVIGERALGASTGYGLTLVRAGAGFGWGAPWSAGERFGASIDAGAALGTVTAPSGVSPGSASFVSPYAQLSVFGRWSVRGPFRPWVALSVAALADTVRVAQATREVALLPRPSAALDVGVAWAAW